MKKKAGQKLQVHRETVRHLEARISAAEAGKAAGGNTSGINCTIFCVHLPNPTYYCCDTD